MTWIRSNMIVLSASLIMAVDRRQSLRVANAGVMSPEEALDA
jgi:hypothetical protein